MKDFLRWIQIKISLHGKKLPESFFFKEREVWWCSLGVNIDVETDGKNESFERPILILKIFSPYLLWAIPFTSKTKAGNFYFPIKYSDGIHYLILSQIRAISSKRLLRKIHVVSENEFLEVRNRIAFYLKSETPA